nr:type II toxin-antitoxin system ParD family antitoxin [Agrobacterium rosae]
MVAGEYASTSEVVRDAMRVWQRDRQEHAERLNAIRARVRRSFDDPRTNLSEQDADTEFEAAFDKIDEYLDRAASERIEQSRGRTPP